MNRLHFEHLDQVEKISMFFPSSPPDSHSSIYLQIESQWESILSGDSHDPASRSSASKPGAPFASSGKSGTRTSDPNSRLSSSPPDPYKFPDDDDDDNREPDFGPDDASASSPATPSAAATPRNGGGAGTAGSGEEASPEKDAAAGKDGVNVHKGGAAQYKNETQLIPTYKGMRV